MSRPPATEATGSILEDAWEGKILALFLIPTFQHVFVELARNAPEASTSGAFGDPTSFLHMMVGVLGLFSIALTIGSVLFAYALAREAGIVVYLVFDFLIASVLQSSTVAVLLLLVAVPTSAIVIYLYRVWMPSQRSRGYAH